MSNSEQTEYLQRRAAQERVAAKLAQHDRAARSHAEMAKRYSDLRESEPVEHEEGDDGPALLRPDFPILP